MAVILFFARDPAGANVILPVYHNLKLRHRAIIYAKDFALKKIRQELGAHVRNIQDEYENETLEHIVSFLQKENPDIIITGTSLDDYTERYLWKASELLHIKSFALLDQWMNLGIRFSPYNYKQAEQYEEEHIHPYLPFRILAMDKLAEKKLIEDGIPEEKIMITGQPHFDTVSKQYQESIEAYSREYYNVVFVSEPILKDYDNGNMNDLYWGFNEKTIFEALYRQMIKIAPRMKKSIRIILRPHPREDISQWYNYNKIYNNDKILLECDNKHDSFSIIKSADLVCGMSSMFLLEAMICKKNVLSIEIGLKRQNPFILDQTGICRSILTEHELYKALTNYMITQTEGIENLSNFKFIENATEHVINAIEKEIHHGHTCN